ncbi:MAG TPA: hypothetical protein VMU04_00965 [Candidatus Acidoferrum sp.]|nr:hypothetical protein [Candidatus Acidoferrum sp.]
MKMIRIAAASALLALSATMQSHGQDTVQPLTITLTAYNPTGSGGVQLVRFTTKDEIRFLVGTNVSGGQLLLVMPISSGVISNTGNMNAYLEVTQNGNDILDVPTPDSFNLFQDSVVDNTSGRVTIAYGTDRYSTDYAEYHSELQAFNTWAAGRVSTIPQPVGSGTGGTTPGGTTTTTVIGLPVGAIRAYGGYNTGATTTSTTTTPSAANLTLIPGFNPSVTTATTKSTTVAGSSFAAGGTFSSTMVTGEGTIDGVTLGGVPMEGSISGGVPTVRQ